MASAEQNRPERFEYEAIRNGAHRSDSEVSLQNPQSDMDGTSVVGRTDHKETAFSVEYLQKSQGSQGGQNLNRPVFTLSDRFGWWTITVLSLTIPLILGAIGFLWFLWMADYKNKTWHAIAIRDWIIRAVTLSSVAVRTSLSLQTAIGTSILAGLALENTQILMLHLATVSMMRNANAGPYMLLWLIYKAFLKDPQRWRRCLTLVLLILLAFISLLAEFTSTALLSDMKQTPIPGSPSTRMTTTNFVYNTNGTVPYLSRGTVWTKKPPFFPTFLEYHEDAENLSSDTADTGLTLRAFLPMESQQQRSMLRDFAGDAIVVDSRVRCVRPQLGMLKAHYAAGPTFGLTGRVNIIPGQEIDFGSVLNYPVTRQKETTPNDWQIGLSYLGRFANASFTPIQSEFRQISSNVSYGMAFLVVNITAGSLAEWHAVLGTDADEYGTFGGTGAQPKAYRGRKEWADLLFTANESLVMSATLCHAAYDSVVLDIAASGGKSNRTEPSPRYSVHGQINDYITIRRQLGQTSYNSQPLTPEDRGILSISRRESWLPGQGDYPKSSWLADAVTLTLDGDPTYSFDYISASSSTKNITANLYDATPSSGAWKGETRLSPDPSITALFQEILNNRGDIAFALQSILTVFTGMVYYDQLERFNSPNQITTTPFIVISRPRSIRGITAVTIVLSVHLILMIVIIHLFLSKTSLSTIGNSWQTFAQIMRGDALELVNMAALSTDSAVEEKVKEQRWKNRLVGLKLSKDSRRVKLVSRDSPGGQAQMMMNEPRKRRRLMV
ncbi:MAG: hypothetical protein Q9200_005888 [Gallowayella weberi]